MAVSTHICTNSAVRRQNALTRKFFEMFFFIFHISPSISILCQKILVDKLLQSTFAIKLCTSLTYAELSRVAKVALLKNFRNES